LAGFAFGAIGIRVGKGHRLIGYSCIAVFVAYVTGCAPVRVFAGFIDTQISLRVFIRCFPVMKIWIIATIIIMHLPFGSKQRFSATITLLPKQVIYFRGKLAIRPDREIDCDERGVPSPGWERNAWKIKAYTSGL
jgi:hypothetical protein